MAGWKPATHLRLKPSDRFSPGAAASKFKSAQGASFASRRRRGNSEDSLSQRIAPLQLNTLGRSIVNINESAWHTMPSLDELLRMPLVDASKLDTQTLADLRRGFAMPVSRWQVEQSLASEFGWQFRKTIMDPTAPMVAKNSWGSFGLGFRDPLTEHAQIAAVIKETLALRANRSRSFLHAGRPGTPDSVRYWGVARRLRFARDADANEAWIRAECEAMAAEVLSKDPARWSSVDRLVREVVSDKENVGAASHAVLKEAARFLACNPSMHPSVKHEVLRHILTVLTEASAPANKQ